MFRSPSFYKSSQAQTPNYIAAAASDRNADNQARARTTNDIMAAAMLYNDAMGDKTPIADFLFSEPTSGVAAEPVYNMAGGVETATQPMYNMAGGVETASTAGSGATSGYFPTMLVAKGLIDNEIAAQNDEGYRKFNPAGYLHNRGYGEDMHRLKVGENLTGGGSSKLASGINEELEGVINPVKGMKNIVDGKGAIGRGLKGMGIRFDKLLPFV